MHTLTLTEDELFVLQIALEGLKDTRDSEYRTVVKIATAIDSRLPRSTTVWSAVAS